jgi:shikimate dehydrogenase
MRTYGLIGFPLGHSFSKSYFAKKFREENIRDASYESFELKNIEEFPQLLKSYPDLKGLNVTIPYKEQIIKFLTDLDNSATRVGAVNVIRFVGEDQLIGYNSDYYGFRLSLEKWLDTDLSKVKALILGTGGAAKAVKAVCEDAGISYLTVSRNPLKASVSYADLNDDPSLVESYKLIINTTPLGMHPRENEMPNLPYQILDNGFYLYDLIYNPVTTLFMEKGQEQGARVKNGFEMLVLQAEKSWSIWNDLANE